MTSFHTPNRNATLSQQVAARLEGLITSGQWSVGTRIPPENDLVTQLGISRNTVREALRSLVHSGLLEARVGDGTYVRSFSELESALVRRARRASLKDAVEMRCLLEQSAAKLAALRRTDADVARMREIFERQRKVSLASDLAAYSEADDALHRTIVDCAGNELLTEIYEHLGGALKLSVSPDLWNQALAAEELPHHQALIEAIAAGDPTAAEGAALAIIRVLREALLPLIN
jgi:DNA-binding FadR family transcriptional regulator